MTSATIHPPSRCIKLFIDIKLYRQMHSANHLIRVNFFKSFIAHETCLEKGFRKRCESDKASLAFCRR
ncbi:hypothetical protein OPV22_024615 [Ensete ventricosum]|uniref:Uncharacterized protein n=1 Tax=Ensete ventricosum TaxID=4639 RepID=A0AAV8Q5J3_ENSVE|nr:hypothetical protein OPV22_024615 [Ensete ventricosum]